MNKPIGHGATFAFLPQAKSMFRLGRKLRADAAPFSPLLIRTRCRCEPCSTVKFGPWYVSGSNTPLLKRQLLVVPSVKAPARKTANTSSRALNSSTLSGAWVTPATLSQSTNFFKPLSQTDARAQSRQKSRKRVGLSSV